MSQNSHGQYRIVQLDFKVVLKLRRCLQMNVDQGTFAVQARAKAVE